MANGQIKGVGDAVFGDIGAFSFHTRNIPRWSWVGKEFQRVPIKAFFHSP